MFRKKIFFFRFAALEQKGAIAQQVEHWTENPGVPGSIPGGTTSPGLPAGFFMFFNPVSCYKYYGY